MKVLKRKRQYKYKNPDRTVLDWFLNPGVEEVTLNCSEFTSLCPITGQPDYAEIRIIYQPDERCLESKSVKLYLGMYRQYGGFAEEITKKICDDLFKVLEPKSLSVVSKFTRRGGVSIESYARYG